MVEMFFCLHFGSRCIVHTHKVTGIVGELLTFIVDKKMSEKDLQQQESIGTL